MEEKYDFGEFDIPTEEWQTAVPTDLSAAARKGKKRGIVVIFVIDISGSMRGARIGAVNKAIRSALEELRQKEQSDASEEIRMAVLEFSTRAQWRTIYPEPVDTFVYRDIENVGGGTNYGQAFAALRDKLTGRQFVDDSAGDFAPIIILMTDGKPSDVGLYKEELALLRRNEWFRSSVRVGIAIEEGALSEECVGALTEFTEDADRVYAATNLVLLARQIRTAALTGVDRVRERGCVPQTPPPTSGERCVTVYDAQPPTAASPAQVPSPATEDAAPTLPLGDIDWSSDFSF